MSDISSHVLIGGLSRLEVEELEKTIASAGAECSIQGNGATLGKGRLGEPVLITLAIVVSPYAISAISLWLAKQKSKRRENFKYSKRLPDGTEEKFEWSNSGSEEAASDVSNIETFLKGVLKC